MSSDRQTTQSFELPCDAIILIGKLGMSSQLVIDKIVQISPDISSTFHRRLIDSKIIESWDNSNEWLDCGYPCQMIQSSQQWQKGRLRLRITAEFIPDEPEIIPADRPIEPSLDAFRESP